MLLPTLAFLAVTAKPSPKLLMVHTMPWFASKPVSGAWGWHWTMGHLDPDKVVNGRREAAAHDRPMIGLYDSGDPQAIECQVLLMKFAGIDGMFVDWYGDVDRYDYLVNHRNTQRLFDAARRAGLRFALVYEDQTVPQLVEGGKFPKERAVEEGRALMERTQAAWFRSPTYLKLDGKPVLLVFGPQYYKPTDWSQMFAGLSPQPAFFTLHHRREPALGAYDWPLPKGGSEGCARERAAFYTRAKEWPAFIPAAYPRFHDFYREAGVHDSWGSVEDEQGKTYETTLTEALKSNAPFVQIATWNDWGEGTEIEPSEEFGYRDLETTQRLRRQILGTRLPYTAADLRLPVRLYRGQKAHPKDARWNEVSRLLFAGRRAEARTKLDGLEGE